MKEKGRNIKIYLLGMLITGTAIGVSSVVADTIINSTNVSYKTTTVKAALDDLYGLTADNIWQKIWPIGSIYTSVSSTSPAVLFGGTWEEFGKGRTLVGVDTSDTSFNTVEKTDGSKTHTIAVGNLPSHAHTYTPAGTIGNTGGGGAHSHSVSNTSATRNTNNTGSHSHSTYASTTAAVSAGSGYLIPWSGGSNQSVRNTSSAGSHSRTVTYYYANTTTGNHTLTVAQMPSHNHTFTGTASSTTACTNCNGTALNTQDPYITVYMWKRTA